MKVKGLTVLVLGSGLGLELSIVLGRRDHTRREAGFAECALSAASAVESTAEAEGGIWEHGA